MRNQRNPCAKACIAAVGGGDDYRIKAHWHTVSAQRADQNAAGKAEQFHSAR